MAEQQPSSDKNEKTNFSDDLVTKIGQKATRLSLLNNTVSSSEETIYKNSVEHRALVDLIEEGDVVTLYATSGNTLEVRSANTNEVVGIYGGLKFTGKRLKTGVHSAILRLDQYPDPVVYTELDANNDEGEYFIEKIDKPDEGK